MESAPASLAALPPAGMLAGVRGLDMDELLLAGALFIVALMVAGAVLLFLRHRALDRPAESVSDVMTHLEHMRAQGLISEDEFRRARRAHFGVSTDEAAEPGENPGEDDPQAEADQPEDEED